MFRDQQGFNRFMTSSYNRYFQDFYKELRDFGFQRAIARNLFNNIVYYVLENSGDYSGTPEQITQKLLNDMRKDNPVLFYYLRFYGVPNDSVNQIIGDVILAILEERGTGPVPPTAPPPTQPPTQPPVANWSNWEDLGGVLTSAPAVAS